MEGRDWDVGKGHWGENIAMRNVNLQPRVSSPPSTAGSSRMMILEALGGDIAVVFGGIWGMW
jgi:hypothetical protein